MLGADGAAYARLDNDLRAMAKFAARLSAVAPPDVEKLRASDLRMAMGLFMGYRSMGSRLAHDFLRVLPMPVGDVVADYVEDDQLRAAIAWRGVRYTSLAPSDAGSAAVLLNDMVGGDGGVAGEMSVCLGGPAALARGLARAAQARGAQIRLNAEVARVTIAGGKVTGVELASGEEIGAGRVVSGLDPRRTLMTLLDPMDLGPTMGWEAANLRQHGGTSAVLFALRDLPAFGGMSEGEAKERLSGRVLLGGSTGLLDRAGDAIKAGRLPETLVLEAVIPTLLDASLLQAGAGNGVGHLMSVVVHGTPYRLRDGDWDAGREALGERVVAQLEAHAPGFAASVMARRVLTPLDLERDYGLTEGHPLHAEPALDQWFAWRPLLGAARYRLPIADGLFLCGSGAHPGGGVTGLPGYLAAREVLAAK
jgi:phytoene dehydrogenase-like protein